MIIADPYMLSYQLSSIVRMELIQPMYKSICIIGATEFLTFSIHPVIVFIVLDKQPSKKKSLNCFYGFKRLR